MTETVALRRLALQAKLFRGFSDSSRLAILEVLRDGSLPVGEVAQRSGLTQSNVSNHLRCLGECGLVFAEQRGRFVYYQLSDDRIRRLLRLADELLAGSARRVFECTNYHGLIEPSPASRNIDRSARVRARRKAGS